MKDELVSRIENNPKYQELVSKRTSLGIKLGVFVLTDTAFCAFIGLLFIIAFCAVVINSGDDASIPIGCLDIPA